MSALVRGNPLKALTQLKYGAVARLARMKFSDTTQGQIDRQVAIIKTMTAVEEGFDEGWANEVARQAVERGVDDLAQSRHHAALRKSGRAVDYTRINAPTVIIQGMEDPLVRLGAARKAANSIPGAQFVPLTGLGHGIGVNRWPDIAGSVSRGRMPWRLRARGRRMVRR
jgi:pimeloyl-ACP methyl ester carboxylesterase